MTVPVMRTSLKVGDLSIPITEIYNNNCGYRRDELDPIILHQSQPNITTKMARKHNGAWPSNGSTPVADKKSFQQTSATPSGSSGTMRCPHKIDKSDGTTVECQYVTNRLSNYRRHEKDMHINHKQEECCNLRFLYRADFRLHVSEIHSGGTSFSCSVCSATFVRRGLLLRHMSVHNPSLKSHKCEKCGYSTSHATNLQRHYRVHEQDFMGVNWEEAHQKERVDISIEAGLDDEDHLFYEFDPLLYGTKDNGAYNNNPSPVNINSFGNCSVNTQRESSKIRRTYKRKRVDAISTDFDGHIPPKTNMSDTEDGLPIDNFAVSSDQDEYGKPTYPAFFPDHPTQFYPDFAAFSNWHPVPYSNSLPVLPSLDSALSSWGIPFGPQLFLDRASYSWGMPFGPQWISSPEENHPDVKPQFSQPREDCSGQYHLTELA